MNLSISEAGGKIFIVIVLASFVAILFGLVAVTANPILVSFAVALCVGAVLLTRPVWITWLVLLLGLLVVGLLPLYAHGLSTKAGWGVSLLCFLLMFFTFAKIATNPETCRGTPAFIWIAFAFFVYALLNSLIQWHSMYELFSGFKRYFQMWGLMFALCWLAIDERDIRRWQGFIVIVALVQLPFVIYQLLVFVPLREGLRSSYPDMVPIDVVAGTFGATLTAGGSNTEMTAFLIIMLAFLLARLREKLIPLWRFLLVAPFLLMPLFLGETKAVLVMLPLMLFVLYHRELILRPHYGAAMLILGTLLTIALAYTYVNLTKSESFYELFEDTLSYNYYEVGYGGAYLNRTTVLTFWVERQGAHDPISFIFGNGLGSSHTPTAGHVAMHYPRHGIGLTAVSTLLWDLGVLGLILFAAIHVLAWRSADRLRRETAVPSVRADASAIQAALALFGFYLFYRISVLETLSFQIVFVILLGYLAWMYRRQFL